MVFRWRCMNCITKIVCLQLYYICFRNARKHKHCLFSKLPQVDHLGSENLDAGRCPGDLCCHLRQHHTTILPRMRQQRSSQNVQTGRKRQTQTLKLISPNTDHKCVMWTTVENELSQNYVGIFFFDLQDTSICLKQSFQ